jgi:hypothetical protein
MATPFPRDVFINCPFDDGYKKFFWAIVFVIVRSGFRPRCALETDDSSENRFEKICKIVQECRYGVHDISNTNMDPASRLPRFNMPLELGVFLGAKRFGTKAQRPKKCLILDKKRYRFQRFISDIAGQDIHSHEGRLPELIKELAAWLRYQSRVANIPGGAKITEEYTAFCRKIPGICKQRGLEPKELMFGDYSGMVEEYLARTA